MKLRGGMLQLGYTGLVKSQYTRAQVTMASENLNHQLPTPKPWEEVPQPPSYPIIGNSHLLLKKENNTIHKFHGKLKKIYGPLYKTTMIGDTFLNVHSPEDVKTLLSNDGSRPIIPGFDAFIHMRKVHQSKVFGDNSGLISQGEEWYRFRQAVQQDMMKPKSALYYLDEIEQVAVEFTDKVAASRDAQGNVKFGNVCNEFALDSIACIFLGRKIGALAGSEDAKVLIGNMQEFMKYALPLIYCPVSLGHWMPFYKKLLKASTDNMNILTRQIGISLETIDIEDVTDESVLAKLVRKHGKDSKVPVIMAMDAISAGIDTTGNTAKLLLYHLAKHPDKQEKLFQEIDSLIGNNGNLTPASIMKMSYLKACQTESQRMLPVTFGLFRQTQVDMALGGYQVPVGTKVLIQNQVTANSPENFSNPEAFMPERWIRGHPDQTTSDAFSNIPFGHGPRYSCS